MSESWPWLGVVTAVGSSFPTALWRKKNIETNSTSGSSLGISNSPAQFTSASEIRGWIDGVGLGRITLFIIVYLLLNYHLLGVLHSPHCLSSEGF
jgi:hypothetical protein